MSNLCDNVPSVDDSSWEERCRPLLDLMVRKGATTIDEIVLWGRKAGLSEFMTKHMLAWLSWSNIVAYQIDEKVWKKVVVQDVNVEKKPECKAIRKVG